MKTTLPPHGQFSNEIVDDCLVSVLVGSFDREQAGAFVTDLKKEAAYCYGKSFCSLTDLRRYELTTMDAVVYSKAELGSIHQGIKDIHRAVVLQSHHIAIFQSTIDPISHDIPTLFTDSMGEAVNWLRENGFRLDGVTFD